MKGMKQQPTDKETAQYNAVAEMAALLRESTTKKLFAVMEDGTRHEVFDLSSSWHLKDAKEVVYEYGNKVFTMEEHETVKRAFLRLVSEI